MIARILGHNDLSPWWESSYVVLSHVSLKEENRASVRSGVISRCEL
jgi:hypothetical protein